MSPLPSFVELMESLGLAPDSKLPLPISGPDSRSQSRASTHSSQSRSPSPSASPSRPPRPGSPTIIISQYETPSENGGEVNFKRRASSGNIKAARFSPYASSTRRGSLPAVGDHQRDGELHRDRDKSFQSSQASSRRSSAGSSSSDSVPPVPPLPVRRARGEAMDRLKLAAASCTPISSFARRRSPQASPTSPSFAQARARGANTELPSPVMIPTLPPILAESLSSFSFPASNDRSNGAIIRRKERRSPSRSPHVIPMDVDSESRPLVKHHQAGLRISSLHRQIAPVA